MSENADWKFLLLKGSLIFNQNYYDTPFEYINAVDEFYNRTPQSTHLDPKPGIDYAALHLATETALTQLWGLRYQDQQDCIALGDATLFAKLNHAERLIALKQAFTFLQAGIKHILPEISLYSGSTACVATVADQNIYLAHLGDSIAYLGQFNAKGELLHLAQLNHYLHQAANPLEKIRIELIMQKKGMNVQEINTIKKSMDSTDPRLFGLALTASLGDAAYDEYGFLHIPEQIEVMPLRLKKATTTYLILATDGLTESLTFADIKKILKNKPIVSAEVLTTLLAESAFAKGSTDNITVLAKAFTETATPLYLSVFDGHGGNKVARLAAALFDFCLHQSIEHLQKKRK